MKKTPDNRVIKGSFNLGGISAEHDSLLVDAFVDNGDYTAIEARTDRRCFVVGRTGSGKSALFAHLSRQHPEQVIAINPENLSLPYVTNLNVVRHLLELEVHLEPFFRALWKHVFIVEVLRHRYRIDSYQKQQTVMDQLRDKVFHDPAKKKALAYLEEFGEKFWGETDVRVKELAEQFEKRIEHASRNMGGGIDLGPLSVNISTTGGRSEHINETKTFKSEMRAQYQAIVNESQIVQLNDMIRMLDDTVLRSDNNFTYIIIDDLDKDWVDDRLQILLIRCLFDAVMDLMIVSNLKVLVALRSNLFEQLDYGSQKRGQQEEKVRGLVVSVKWTRNDLRRMIQERIHVASERLKVVPPFSLEELLPGNKGPHGDAIVYVLDRTLKRPRDVIAYFNLILREAAGKRRFNWKDVIAAEREHSHTRLDALRDEWKDPYLDIDKVFQEFRRVPAVMTRNDYSKRLDEVAMLMANGTFQGRSWLGPIMQPLWTLKSCTNWMDCYGAITKLLYEISFIGIAFNHNDSVRYSFDVDFQRGGLAISESATFAVHPAFHAALEVQKANTGRRGSR